MLEKTYDEVLWAYDEDTYEDTFEEEFGYITDAIYYLEKVIENEAFQEAYPSATENIIDITTQLTRLI